MRTTHLVPLCLLFATACGDDKAKQMPPDARPRADAAVAVDASTVIPCAYTEMSDATNDDYFGSGTAENTGISFTAGTAVCGKLNMGHFMPGNQNVDADSFMFNVPANTRGILHLTAPGAENIDAVSVEIYGMTNAISEIGRFQGNFAVTAADLPAGNYEITVTAYDATDTTVALDYKLTLQVDPATRCPKSTAAAFAEAAEGAPVGGGNDVYEVRYAGNTRAFTALGTDAPENTGITVQPGMSYHVTGTNSTFTAPPVSWMDSFQDRDTYAITMGPTTNELAVRLNWPGTTSDFDFFVFPMNNLSERARGWYGQMGEDEFTTLAVTPGATYWVFVGADDASTGQPINYDVTFCGTTFTP